MAPTACVPYPWKYEVFISFRGKDTDAFVRHLFDALCRNQILAFKDENFERGEEISYNMLQIIEKSYVSVVILSENYAKSSWCLDELAKIIECNKVMGAAMLPVFYNIDPIDVQKLTGSYGDALVKHREEFKYSEKVETWSQALKETAAMPGLVSNNPRLESKLIEETVTQILERLNHILFNDLCYDGLVGIETETRVKDVEALLHLKADDVRFIGTRGISGIGKKSLASKVFDSFSFEFEGQCFFPNVRKKLENKFTSDGLQHKILSEAFGIENTNVDKPIMRKKVLIVLDDASDLGALKFLMGDNIIYFDKQVLKNKCNGIYEVRELNFDEALQLFSLHAFKHNPPTEALMKLAKRSVQYTQVVPLALQVVDSSLYSKNVVEWEDQFKKLEVSFHRKIQDILGVSCDGLDDNNKEIFLDITCFLKLEDKDQVERASDCLGPFATIQISCLNNKCLTNISHDKIQLHDLSQQMGKDIDIVESWSHDLNKTAVLSGLVSHNPKLESKLIEKIVTYILERLNLTTFPNDHCDHDLVGIEPHIKEVESLLHFKDADVAFTEIWEMGGIGQDDDEAKPNTTQEVTLQLCSSPGILKVADTAAVASTSCTVQESTRYDSIPQHFDGCSTSQTDNGTEPFPGEEGMQYQYSSCNSDDRIKPFPIQEGTQQQFSSSGLLRVTDKAEDVASPFLAAQDYKLDDGILQVSQNGDGTEPFPSEDEMQHQYYSSPGILKVTDKEELGILPLGMHSIRIEDCDALDSLPPEILSRALSLLHLYLINCGSLTSFPVGHHSSMLKTLQIGQCRKLSFYTIETLQQLEHLCIRSSCDSLNVFLLDFFPKLRILCLQDCINLHSLSFQEGQSQNGLKSLESLEIKDCPNFESFPEDGLSAPNLTSIFISNCTKLHSLPINMLNLKSLQSLFISKCPELESLPADGLPSRLNLLCIRNCDKITLKKECKLNELQALTHFEIEGGCEDIQSFPEVGLLPSSLISLCISRLPHLKLLDKQGFQEFTSLEKLEINCCKRLRFLPEELPSSLSCLSIKECPLLKANILKKKETDWSMICEIPNVYIDDEEIY